MLDSINGVIFDLDGTLIDSMWVWRKIDIEYLGKRGIPFSTNLQEAIEGMTCWETADYIKNEFTLPDTTEMMIQEWHDMARDHYKYNVSMKPGALEYIQFLKSKGIRTGIATSNTRDLVEIVLNSLGIFDIFDYITTGDDVVRGKPSPDIYLNTANRIEIQPDACLVFEDVPMGIMAGKCAGMKVCAVEDLFSHHLREEKKNMADYYINDFTEILEK